MGGHVIFSHFQYFDDLVDAAVGVGDEYWYHAIRPYKITDDDATLCESGPLTSASVTYG